MKRVVTAQDIHALLAQEKTFLNRSDIEVFTASTSDEALEIHRAQRADLIITRLDLPGMAAEEFCAAVREDPALRGVSIIMVCANTPDAIRASSRCRANAVLLEPLHPVLVTAKAQQLLFIAPRETLRVLLNVGMNGVSGHEAFYCRTKNVSASGMLIETEKPIAEGARLFCQFYLPNARKIQATGKIIRIIERTHGDEDYQYGLMFTDITDETRHMLEEYVEETASGKE